MILSRTTTSETRRSACSNQMRNEPRVFGEKGRLPRESALRLLSTALNACFLCFALLFFGFHQRQPRPDSFHHFRDFISNGSITGSQLQSRRYDRIQICAVRTGLV